MSPVEYVKNAVRTLSNKWYPPVLGIMSFSVDAHINIDVLHAITGCVTESGEMLDVFKKAAFYGKPVDYVNLDEEMGDLLWYVAIYCHARGINIEFLMEHNINKLKVRYPEKFTEHNANNRDLAAERASLENMSPDEVLKIIDECGGPPPRDPRFYQQRQQQGIAPEATQIVPERF